MNPFMIRESETNSRPSYCRLEQAGAWNLTFEPIVIGISLTLGEETVTRVRPTDNSTIFIVVEGLATIDGTLVVDMSGRDYNSTYTIISVVRAGKLDGGFQMIQVENAPKGYSFTLATFAPPSP